MAQLKFNNRFNPDIKIAIIKSYPNMSHESILAHEGFNAILFEGTGLGHIPSEKMDVYTEENEKIYSTIKKFSKKMLIAISPQTIYGRINLNVYSPQRKLKEIGVLGHLCDMTTETAYIKIAWLLSNFDLDDAKKLYEKNLFGEISQISSYFGYVD
jgi:glutamyl-tRNA(Gln) amidotransferase subunit D